ncbi:MAG TPA: GNAT family N-acetyltransferase [Burkholderiaceae bacterium]
MQHDNADPVRLVHPESPADLERLRELLVEYQRALGVDLCFQDFDRELASLPGAYAPPAGRLYLCRVGAREAGCGALRGVDAATAEMKRLYVRPPFRGRGIGRLLAQTLIADAAQAGYRRIVLDTLPSMSEAHALYEALGFREIAAYTFNPVPGTRFLGLSLAPAR